MGRKTNKQKIADRIKDCLTVGEFKAILAELPDEMPVGCGGHFGEFLSMDEDNIRVRKVYVTPDGNWRSRHRQDVEILEVHSPDRGPDPD